MKHKSQGFASKILRPRAAGGRREFLQTSIVGAGATILAGASTGQNTGAQGRTRCDVLLLSCMDFRLIHHVGSYMTTKRGLSGNYDHVILAGASLGANNEMFPAWGQTFWDHLRVARRLHGINKVIVMDHRSCGAYREILGQDLSSDPPKEREQHASILRELRKQIKEEHPELDVELLLMNLRGGVETIS